MTDQNEKTRTILLEKLTELGISATGLDPKDDFDLTVVYEQNGLTGVKVLCFTEGEAETLSVANSLMGIELREKYPDFKPS